MLLTLRQQLGTKYTESMNILLDARTIKTLDKKAKDMKNPGKYKQTHAVFGEKLGGGGKIKVKKTRKVKRLKPEWAAKIQAAEAAQAAANAATQQATQATAATATTDEKTAAPVEAAPAEPEPPKEPTPEPEPDPGPIASTADDKKKRLKVFKKRLGSFEFKEWNKTENKAYEKYLNKKGVIDDDEFKAQILDPKGDVKLYKKLMKPFMEWVESNWPHFFDTLDVILWYWVGAWAKNPQPNVAKLIRPLFKAALESSYDNLNKWSEAEGS